MKRNARSQIDPTVIRVAGVDDWAWRRGTTYGTIIVDLERRQVVDLLPDRSAVSTANWLKAHPEIEIVSRDRGELYADDSAGCGRDRIVGYARRRRRQSTVQARDTLPFTSQNWPSSAATSREPAIPRRETW